MCLFLSISEFSFCSPIPFYSDDPQFEPLLFAAMPSCPVILAPSYIFTVMLITPFEWRARGTDRERKRKGGKGREKGREKDNDNEFGRTEELWEGVENGRSRRRSRRRSRERRRRREAGDHSGRVALPRLFMEGVVCVEREKNSTTKYDCIEGKQVQVLLIVLGHHSG